MAVETQQISSNYNHYETRKTVNSRDEDTIDLVALFYMLLGHIWKIILVMFLSAVVAFGYTKIFVTPLYKSTAKIYVVSASNNSVINLSDLQVGTQLTADYQELLTARPLLQDVIANLNLEYSYQQLEGMISITNTSDTRILKIDVTTDDAQLSADIANELVKQALTFLPSIMETEEPNIIESAIPATTKSSPSYSKNTIMGALIGAVAICGYYTVKFLMNDTLITPDDIERFLGEQPLATIPEAITDTKHIKKKKSTKTKGVKA